MKNIVSPLCFLLIILLGTHEGQSQIHSNNPFLINALMNRFWQNDTTAFLEIATACYPNQVAPYQDSAGIHKSIELWIKIKNKSMNQFVRADRFRIPVTTHDSSNESSTNSLINKFTYQLDQGSYMVSIYGFDNGNPLRRDSAILSVEILHRPKTIAFSDVELASNITESNETKNSFYKNSLCVIPNPSLVFGRTNCPVIFYYVEMYNLNKDSTYTIETLVKDQNGDIQKSSRKKKRFGVMNAVEVGTTPVMNLPSGKYVYQVRLLDNSLKEVVATKRQFFINNPQIKIVTPPISMRSVDFLGMPDDKITDEFNAAKYLATDQEIKTFSNIATTEGRREFLAEFWSKIESGQHGQTELTRAVYLDRVLTANQRYHALGKDGWKTDRGRVYLMYAEPDEVERYPSSNNSKPYEIWNYNQIESGVIFVFIDQSGFGDYRLVHSTKRGELQDESWQQHLQ